MNVFLKRKSLFTEIIASHYGANCLLPFFLKTFHWCTIKFRTLITINSGNDGRKYHHMAQYYVTQFSMYLTLKTCHFLLKNISERKLSGQSFQKQAQNSQSPKPQRTSLTLFFRLFRWFWKILIPFFFICQLLIVLNIHNSFKIYHEYILD